MLSTAGELQWATYLSIAAMFGSICAVAFFLTLRRTVREEFLGKSSLFKLRAEIDELSGDLADLTNRFSRFQKREGMQAAREAKRSAASLQAEAAEILQSGSTGSSSNSNTSDKLGLYQKIRNH